MREKQISDKTKIFLKKKTVKKHCKREPGANLSEGKKLQEMVEGEGNKRSAVAQRCSANKTFSTFCCRPKVFYE